MLASPKQSSGSIMTRRRRRCDAAGAQNATRCSVGVRALSASAAGRCRLASLRAGRVLCGATGRDRRRFRRDWAARPASRCGGEDDRCAVSISTLGEIAGIGLYDELLDAVAEGPVAETGGTGILIVPDALRDALASADFEATSTAAKWAATEEPVRSGSTTEEARAVLQELSDLA